MNLLKAVRVARKDMLTPKAKKLYEVGLKFKKLGRKLLFENTSFKKKMKLASNFVNDKQFAYMNDVTKTFIQSQLRLLRKKPRGRRFSLDDKIFALSICRRGPKVYKLLLTMFALPRKRTLMKMLEKIPFNVGVNPAIMTSLQKAVQKLSNPNKMCTLMFDEVFLDAGLTYNIKNDQVDGFHDTGLERKLQFADHAFVMMLRGVRKCWKQPICYYFVANGLSAAMIQRELKTTIRKLQEIGLTVMATVCDQACSNIAGINMLIKETRQTYLRRKDTNRATGLFGFEIDSGNEIIPLYDTPHLLKGIRNNLLENDAIFEESAFKEALKCIESTEASTSRKPLPKKIINSIQPCTSSEQVPKEKIDSTEASTSSKQVENKNINFTQPCTSSKRVLKKNSPENQCQVELQKKKVKATSNKVKMQTASWNDILEMYKGDGDHVNYKVCHKLTDAHLYKDKIKKMKVRIAAQVLSRSVSAALRWKALKGNIF